jgi:hypothetical protein
LAWGFFLALGRLDPAELELDDALRWRPRSRPASVAAWIKKALALTTVDPLPGSHLSQHRVDLSRRGRREVQSDDWGVMVRKKVPESLNVGFACQLVELRGGSTVRVYQVKESQRSDQL